MSVDRAELLGRFELDEALLSRTDLAALGLPRRAIDALFKEAAKLAGVVILPGYSRPMIRVATYRTILAASSYGLDRVWPS